MIFSLASTAYVSSSDYFYLKSKSSASMELGVDWLRVHHTIFYQLRISAGVAVVLLLDINNGLLRTRTEDDLVYSRRFF